MTDNLLEKTRMRYKYLLVICCLVLMVAGCKTRLNFITGSPIQTPYRVNEGVIAVYPDEIRDRIYKVKVGGLLDGKYYQVPVQEAYAAETTARLSPMFTRGVSVLNQSVYDQITPLNAVEPASRDESKERNLDVILEDIKKKESKDETAPKQTEKELVEEAFRAADLQAIQDKQHVYLLQFRNTLLGFVDGRARVSFQVVLADRRTGNILMQGQYQGRSEKFTPRINERTNEIELVRLVRQSLSGAMGQMIDDVAVATGASGSKK